MISLIGNVENTPSLVASNGRDDTNLGT